MAIPLPVGFKFYKAMIATAAANNGLSPALVAAIVWQESAFNADAFRFEPDFFNRYLKTNPKFATLNPRRVSSSYGLMQVMYSRVFEDKIADNDAMPPEGIFVPEIALALGCGLLAELLKWGQNVSPTDSDKALLAAIAAYNGGRGGNDPTKNWPLRNGSYARDVLAKRALLEAEYGPVSQ